MNSMMSRQVRAMTGGPFPATLDEGTRGVCGVMVDKGPTRSQESPDPRIGRTRVALKTQGDNSEGAHEARADAAAELLFVS